MSFVAQPHIYKARSNYSGKPISISGPSAVGKSTLGINLALKLGLSFYDLDDEVCKVAGHRTTQELIQSLGHKEFKVIQHKCLKDIVESNAGCYVLASGGEIVRPGYTREIIGANRKLIEQYTYNICLFPSTDLDESVEILLPRINDGKRDIQTTGDTADKFRKYIDVFDQYDDLSQLTVITHSASLDDVLSLIMEKVDHT